MSKRTWTPVTLPWATPFPTRYKEKLPESLSHPVGAKRISDTLNGVPQALEIAFRIPRRLREIWEKEKSYPVLEIQYWRNLRDPLPFPEWEIYVHPVPRYLKYRISELLISEGLPRIRSWLISPSRPKSNEGAERLSSGTILSGTRLGTITHHISNPSAAGNNAFGNASLLLY